MLREWSSSEQAVIPEDLAQHLLVGVSHFVFTFFLKFPYLMFSICQLSSFQPFFYFQATRQMELAEFLESKVIQLWRDALKVISSSLAGMATQGLWDLLESIWGPERHLAPQPAEFDEDDEYEDEEEEGTPDVPLEPVTPLPSGAVTALDPLTEAIEASKLSAAQEAEARDQPTVPVTPVVSDLFSAHLSSAVLPAKHKRPNVKSTSKKTKEDKVPIEQAMPVRPSSKATLSYTGIDVNHISSRIKGGSQSVYRCLFGKSCDYTGAQKALIATHVCRVHLSISLACKFCTKTFWTGTGWEAHQQSCHKDEADWYDVAPNLSGLKAEPISSIE